MKQAPEEKSISKEERYVCLHDTRKEHCDDSYAYHERSELKLFYDKAPEKAFVEAYATHSTPFPRYEN